ncbi:hypothetical protein E7Z59_13240 [Robertkochia marina]|uniref:Ava_C0101 and related proteins n=1 Tax=Robertkochia marina TaxID=1227945 RepID=A0A4S3LYQ9_9FLAO|nr:DUF5996 family protein [Robertkochia marina]THD66739.1 hypothetical protein E7Z59_13240 [Robertkochia marina]TRZ42371.1 hypothetical protein D3A96_11960 [Robertkochia marina]
MESATSIFPPLPLEEWEATKETFHRYLQIIGKIRLTLMPRKNHWWYITLYTNSRGFGTGSIPYKDLFFEIQVDVVGHKVIVSASNGKEASFELYDGLSVAKFYARMMESLDAIGVKVQILAKPYDLSDDVPFAECEQHHSYQKAYVERFWQIMLQVDHIFKEFSGRSYSKTCPVHLYWHHMDLAVTRFSGEKGPEMKEAGVADKDAYSHEVISFGFWAGDAEVRAPAFYSYTYPSPEGLDREPLKPEGAQWIDSNGSPMALLMYDDIRDNDNPKELLMQFLESAYQAGAKRAGWDIEELRVPSIEEMKRG